MSPARWAAWGSALVGVLVFLPTLFHGFAYDDLGVILGNPALQDLGRLPELLASPWWPERSGGELGVWRPATSLILALSWAAGGGAPWVFHLVQIVLHGAVAAVVALLTARLFGVGAAWGAGLVFATHPVHVEAVANVVGIAEVLAALAVISACLILVGRDVDEKLGVGRTAGIALLFGAGLLAKEVAAVLPALILVVDAVRWRAPIARCPGYLARRAPLFAALAAVLAVGLGLRSIVLVDAVRTLPPRGAELLADIPAIWTMAPIWIEYLRLMVLPLRLQPEYGPATLDVWVGWGWPGIRGVFVAMAVLAVAVWAARLPGDREAQGWRMAIPMGVLWFVVAVLPVSNLVFVGGVLLAERTLYLASVGAAILLGTLGAAAVDRRRGLLLPLLLVPLGLGARSLDYIPAWANHEAIRAHLIERAPENGTARWWRADALLEAGRMSEARAEYRSAAGVLGTSYRFLVLSGGRLRDAGEDAFAVPLLARAAGLRAQDPAPAQMLASIALGRERWPEAEGWARHLLAADSSDLVAWHLLAGALAGAERWGEAAEAREALLRRGERQAWQQWHWLAEARARSGSLDAARAAADSARARGAEEPVLDALRALMDSVAEGGH